RGHPHRSGLGRRPRPAEPRLAARGARVTPPPDLEPDEDEALPPAILTVQLDAAATGVRLDKALADALPELSRARLQALIADGAVRRNGGPAGSGSARAAP